MRIDERVEEHVREAYRGIVAEDGDRMTAAFQDLSHEEATLALAYGLLVVGFVVHDVLREGPTDEDYEVIARRAVEAMSDWVDLGDHKAVAALLRAAATGDVTVPGVPREDVLGHTFVMGAYLLQSYRREDQNWWDYLDDIWALLAATPEPTG